MQINKRYIILISMLFAVIVSYSQDNIGKGSVTYSYTGNHQLPDSCSYTVYFRKAYRYVEPAYRNNNVALEKLRVAIDSAKNTNSFVSVELHAYASPSGGDKYNDILARNRINELLKWVLANCNVGQDEIKYSSGGIGWRILRDLVSESDAAYKDKVVNIIDNTPFWVFDSKGNIVSGRRKELMDLNYGRTWVDMEKRFFPEVRCGVAVVVHTIKKEEPLPPLIIEEEPVLDVQDSVVVAPVVPEPVPVVEPEVVPAEPAFSMAVKTNILYDVALVPNVGVEFHVGKNFTVGGNWMYAWWRNDNKHDYWRIYGGDVYVRKYFGKRAKEKPYQGHHVGVYAQAVTYDFETGGRGVIGGVPGGNIFDKLNYTFMAEYGYALPIARRLNLDFSIGVGYFGGEYQEYKPIDDCYVWQATKKRHYIGPTKAEVSLVWLLGPANINVGKGGAR